jgi:hypothetical protein
MYALDQGRIIVLCASDAVPFVHRIPAFCAGTAYSPEVTKARTSPRMLPGTPHRPLPREPATVRFGLPAPLTRTWHLCHSALRGTSHPTETGGAVHAPHKRKVLIGVGAIVLAMLVYPPYRVYGWGGNSSAVIQSGYPFLFELPNRATVDVTMLLVQWVGALIVGAIAYFLLKGK